MRRLLSVLLAFLPALASAEEAITSFDSAVRVETGGALAVTETIRVNAEGIDIRRGVYRDFPTRYALPNGAKVSTTFDVVSVTQDGAPARWTTEPLSNGVRLRIGEAEIFLERGEHTYVIAYRTERQLYHGAGFDELYWNVTGTGWGFPIDRARAAVALPEGAAIGETRAFTGPEGASGQDFRAERLGPGAVAFETTRRLGPYEGLTVVVTWPEGFVARPTAADRVSYFLADNLAILLAYAGFLLVALYFFLAWREVGKDPKGGAIVAAYSPPKGLSPAATRFLVKRGYDDKAFAAAIVSMAVKGFLKIHEDDTRKFRFEQVGSDQPLTPGEKAIAAELFSPWTKDIEASPKNHAAFRQAENAHEEVLRHAHENIHFLRNQKHFWAGAAISLAIAVLTVLAAAGGGGFETFLVPVVVTLYGFFFFMLFRRFRLLKSAGSLGGRIGMAIAGFVLLAHAIGFGGSFVLGGVLANFYLIVPFLLMLGLNVLFYNLLEKPTVEGRKLLDEIEGFKLYLGVAEKERLDFHTPELTPATFERYLPYAIALGVETKWAEKFEAAMEKAGFDPRAYRPVWYSGGNFYGGGFTRGGFASGFSGAFAGAIAAAATPPSHGGSMGGGFSGGGGGGGGGGGW